MLRQLTNYNKNNSTSKAIWLLGVVLLVIGLLANLFLSKGEGFFSYYSFLLNLDIRITILFMIFVVPVVEELVFRGWILSNHKIVHIISSIFYSFIVIVLHNNNYFIIGLTIISFVIFNYKVKKPYNYVKKIMFSSLVFSLVHYNDNFAFLSNLVYLISTFGAGLILTQIAIKYKFITAIITHIAFNFSSYFIESKLLPNKEFNITIEGVDIKRINPFHKEGIGITEYTANISPFSNDTVFSCIPKNMNVYHISNHHNFENQHIINLRNEVIRHFDIKDTILEHNAKIVLDFTDFKSLEIKNDSEYYLTSIRAFIKMLRNKHKMKIKIKGDFINKTIAVPITFTRSNSYTDLKLFFESYGVKLIGTKNEFLYERVFY